MSNMELTLLRSRRWGEQGGHGQKREHHKLSTGGAVVNKINLPQQECRLFKKEMEIARMATPANLDMHNLKFQKTS